MKVTLASESTAASITITTETTSTATASTMKQLLQHHTLEKTVTRTAATPNSCKKAARGLFELPTDLLHRVSVGNKWTCQAEPVDSEILAIAAATAAQKPKPVNQSQVTYILDIMLDLVFITTKLIFGHVGC